MKSVLAAFVLAVAGLLTDAVSAHAQMAAAPQVPLIEPAQVRGLISLGGKLTIIDVRTPEEYAQGHLNGAMLMPLDKLPNTYSTLPKKGKLIVYCRSGHRSAKAVQFLTEHGYSNAVSMNGGYLAWSQH
jgi:rhodanese-related sulfurtransferase